VLNEPKLDAFMHTFMFLGPILFVLYTADLIQLIQYHGLCPQLYADDTKIYGFC